MAKVYEHIDMSCLPDEYLPDDYEGPSAGPTKQIIGIAICVFLFIDSFLQGARWLSLIRRVQNCRARGPGFDTPPPPPPATPRRGVSLSKTHYEQLSI